MTRSRSPSMLSSRVIGRSSQSGPLQGVVTLGTIGQMALFVSSLKCQHYYDSGQSSQLGGAGGGWARPCTMPTSERGDLPRAPVRPSVMKRLERNCASASPPPCPSGGESRDEGQYRVPCGAVARRLGEREDDERTRLPLPRRNRLGD